MEQKLRTRAACDRLVDGLRPPTGAQVSVEQALAVRAALHRQSDGSHHISASLLVFGLGNDAPMWHNMTTGRVAFIEDEAEWVERARAGAAYLEAHVVRYAEGVVATAKVLFSAARRSSWPRLDLRPQLPPSVREQRWDVVVVDAPKAGAQKNPGRQQSIYTAARLVRPGAGAIFVDDCERENERFFAAAFLGERVGRVQRAECASAATT